jgi:hypothetical protein
VICRLHYLWSPFKIIFCLFPSTGHTLSFTLGQNTAFYRKTRKCNIEGFMITAAWTHLRMFLNSNVTIFVLKCEILLTPVQGAVDGNLRFPVPSMNRLNETEPATYSIVFSLFYSIGFANTANYHKFFAFRSFTVDHKKGRFHLSKENIQTVRTLKYCFCSRKIYFCRRHVNGHSSKTIYTTFLEMFFNTTKPTE